MKFCQHCAKELPIVVGMKFCPFCNGSLASLGVTPTQRPVADTFTPFSPRGDDDDDLHIDHIQSIRQITRGMTKLDVEVVNFQRPKETIGDVAGGQVNAEEITPRPALNVDTLLALKEFEREAGSLRK